MRFFHSLSAAWARLRYAARREFLRDPTVVLLERHGDQGFGAKGEAVGGR